MNKNTDSTIKLLLRAFLLLVFVYGACSKEDATGEENPPTDGKRAKTEQGKPLGAVTTKRIGKEGGTIELPSRAVTVTIPAGAVQEETTFGIEMITNTNPAAVGDAYRLTPSNITLSKPVTVSFSVEKMKDKISVPDALATAYQTKEGYWNILAGQEAPVSNGQLRAITTHLGDIGPMQWLFLKPAQSSVSVNKSVELQAMRYIDIPAGTDDFLVMPLVSKSEAEEIPVFNPVLLEARYIKKWGVNGPGTLIPEGNKAQYKALSSVWSGNAATVSAELKTNNDKVLLVSNLKITTDGYLRIRVNGGPFINLNGVADYFPKPVFGVNGRLPDNTKVIFVMTGKIITGSYPWDDKDIGGNNATNATFGYALPSGDYYSEWFEPGNGIPKEASPGSLEILEIGKEGEYVIGKFSATKAGFYRVDHQYAGTGKIEGEFKIFFLRPPNNTSKENEISY